MRYGINVLLAILVVAAIIFWFVLSEIRSERYYVLSNLHIQGWDLRTIGEKELDQMIFGKESDSFHMSNTTDGITISVQMFGVAFSTDTTRWQYTQAVNKLDEAMQAFLKRNPDLVADWAAIEVYALDATDKPNHKIKRQISYTRFETYPPE
ncbi:MAG: hypothetical protein ACPGLY_27355 [Rubripirellula sp.]